MSTKIECSSCQLDDSSPERKFYLTPCKHYLCIKCYQANFGFLFQFFDHTFMFACAKCGKQYSKEDRDKFVKLVK